MLGRLPEEEGFALPTEGITQAEGSRKGHARQGVGVETGGRVGVHIGHRGR